MYYQGQQNNVLPQTQKDGMNMQGGMQTRSSSSKLSKKKVMKILAGVVVMNCLYSNFSDPSARRTEASFSQTSPSVPLELLQAIQANNKKDKTKLASSDGRDLLESQDANDINNEEKDDNMKLDTSEPKNDERDLRRGDDDDGDDDDDNNDNDEGDEKDAEDDGEEQVHGLMSKFFKKKEGDDEDGNGNGNGKGKGNDAEFKTFMEEKDQEPIYDITKLTSSDASNPDSDPRDLTFLSDPINEQVNVGESLRSLNFAYPDDEPERKKELRNLNFAYPGSDSDNDEEKSDRGGRDEDGDRDLDRDEYDDRDSNGDGRSSRGGDGEMNEPDVDSPYHLKNLNLDPESLQNMDAETLNKILEVNNINPDVLPKFGDDMGMGGGSSSGSSGSGGGSNQLDQDRFQGGDNGMRASDFSFGAGGGGGGDQFGDNGFQSGVGGSGRGGFNDNFQPDMRSSEGGGSILDIAQNNMAGSNEFNSGGDMRSNDSGFGGNQFNGGSNDFGSGSSNGNDNGFQQGGMASNNSAMSGGPSFDNCDARPWIPAPKQERVTPTMNASYPGSGARLSWKLIRAVTGHMTSDDAVDDGQIARQGLAISIKSHYPAHGSNDELFKPFSTVERSVLLVRNPANAIPSFLSYLYERQNGLENHSTRAPLDYWVEWRDNNFDQELQSWVEHTLFWLEHNRKENLLVVAYEHLIDPKYGPDELANIGNFIAQTSGIQLPQKPENIPCVWDFVVNSRGDKQPQSHRSGGPKRWPYTDRQIDMLVSYLSSLGKMYPEMAYIMDEYIVDCLAIQAYSRNMSLNGSN